MPALQTTQPTTQLETINVYSNLGNCTLYHKLLCNIELKAATVTKIKRTSNSNATEHVCIIYITKITLDGCKSLTKNSRTISQHSPTLRNVLCITKGNSKK